MLPAIAIATVAERPAGSGAHEAEHGTAQQGLPTREPCSHQFAHPGGTMSAVIARVGQQASPCGSCKFPSAKARPQRPHRQSICRAEQRQGDRKSDGGQLEALDALLGASPPAPPPPADGDAEPAASQQQEGEGWFWWDRPAGPQTAPLRKRGMEVSCAVGRLHVQPAAHARRVAAATDTACCQPSASSPLLTIARVWRCVLGQ